jgi:thiol-disulfide isomerase/thioredoxin
VLLAFYVANQAFLAERRPAARSVPPAVGLQAPAFELTSLEGERYTLQSVSGKVVIINFWATWCPPCVEEMPLLQKYADLYPDRLIILGVNQLESRAEVQQFADDYNLSFPLLLDQNGAAGRIYYANNLPMTYFIEPGGNIKGVHLGKLDEKMLLGYLKNVGIQP